MHHSGQASPIGIRQSKIIRKAAQARMGLAEMLAPFAFGAISGRALAGEGGTSSEAHYGRLG
jgi:hypothetical protein